MFKQKSEVMFAKSMNITTPSIKTHVSKKELNPSY